MKLNYVVSVFFGICLAGAPFFIVSFYNYNFSKLADHDFEEKWGAPYESLRKDSRWSLLYPVTFVLRRVVFAFISIFMPNSLMIQLAV